MADEEAKEQTLEDFDFEKGDAGASGTYPKEAGQIRKGQFMMIKGRPCKVFTSLCDDFSLMCSFE